MSSLSCYSQKSHNERVFFDELNNFVDSAKENSIKRGAYNVYVASFHNQNVENNYCFTFGYIVNFYDMESISVDYYKIIDGEILLIDFNDASEEFIRKWKFNRIDDSFNSLVLEKLTPEGVFITGISQGLVICFNDSSFEKYYFENADLIPNNQSIWKSFPEGGIFELIQEGE